MEESKAVGPVAYNDQFIVTTEQLAQAFEVLPNTLLKNFRRHKSEFIEEVHYLLLEGERLKQFLAAKFAEDPQSLTKFAEDSESLANSVPEESSDTNFVEDSGSPANFAHLSQRSVNKIRSLYLWTLKGAFAHAWILKSPQAKQAYERIMEQAMQQQVQELQTLRQREQKLLPERVTNEQAYEVIGTIGNMVQSEELFPEMSGVDRFHLKYALKKAHAGMKGHRYQYFSTKGKDAGRMKEYPDDTEEDEAYRSRQEKLIRDKEMNKTPEVIEQAILDYLQEIAFAGDIYDFESVVDAHRYLIEDVLKQMERAGVIKKWTKGNPPMYTLVEDLEQGE